MVAKVMTLNSLHGFGFVSLNKVRETALRANLLTREARAAFRRARIEMRHGEEARLLSKSPQNEKFVEIAAWHYEQCAAKALQAETDFLLAEQLQNGKRREYCRQRAEQAAEIFARAERAALKLSNEQGATK